MSASDVGYLAAFGGGIVSFLSPCVLPIVPAYVSVMTGVDVAAARPGSHRWRIAGHTALFVAGFAAVFIALGLSATAAGSTLAAHRWRAGPIGRPSGHPCRGQHVRVVV